MKLFLLSLLLLQELFLQQVPQILLAEAVEARCLLLRPEAVEVHCLLLRPEAVETRRLMIRPEAVEVRCLLIQQAAAAMRRRHRPEEAEVRLQELLLLILMVAEVKPYPPNLNRPVAAAIIPH
jgi:hypothetical protein